MLAAGDGDNAWRLVLPDDKPLSRTAAKKLAKAAAAATEPVAASQQTLDFNLDEVREARLVPVVDFKGRRGLQGDQAGGGDHAGRMADKVDGGQD